ncbi:hypothetical protein [Paludisphaera rhizosphaerae]|uniref:hypothetical protein n=1 Tax=Paludisphaera rhizosphaerae TaxID=2711216 RepID=UPI0013EBA1BA|nr:hypothetical protein [Paludisphaera rhizosphaerae]
MTASRRRSTRRGSLLLETAMSAFMLMLAMTIVVQAISSVANARRNWDRRMIAANEVSNQVERLAARRFEELKSGPVDGLKLSTEAQGLPSADLKAEVVAADAAGGVDSKRISVQLRWRNAAGDWSTPVRLTTWIHRRKEGA